VRIIFNFLWRGIDIAFPILVSGRCDVTLVNWSQLARWLQQQAAGSEHYVILLPLGHDNVTVEL
jgi:hypothetical protein